MKQMQIMYKTCENDVKVPGHIIFTSFAYYFRFVLTFWGPELGPRSPSSGVPGSGRAQPGTVGPGQFQCFFDVLVGSDPGPTWEHPGATRGNPYSRSNSGKMWTEKFWRKHENVWKSWNSENIKGNPNKNNKF
jgi:hypothetical protein